MKEKHKNKIAIKSKFSPAILILDNKTIFKGFGLGYQGDATGEVCFNTSLTGYQGTNIEGSAGSQLIANAYSNETANDYMNYYKKMNILAST